MKIVVTGGGGQLGRAIASRAPRGVRVAALSRAELDVTDAAALARAVAGADVVVHAAAITDLAACERDPARADAVHHLAAAALVATGVRLIVVSTDHVLAPPGERGVYADTKAAGERVARAAGASVVRTSWLFASPGRGFVQRILARARVEVRFGVVADQLGCPTFAGDVADAILDVAAAGAPAGIRHVRGEPAVSRHAFAEAIVAEARRHVALACVAVEPIATPPGEHPPRPRRVVLEVSEQHPPRPWRPSLAAVVARECGAAP